MDPRQCFRGSRRASLAPRVGAKRSPTPRRSLHSLSARFPIDQIAKMSTNRGSAPCAGHRLAAGCRTLRGRAAVRNGGGFAKCGRRSMSGAARSEGRVAAIRGAVVDLVFEDGPPPIDDAVEIVDAEGRIVVAEIQAQLDARSARAIALEPTTGLRRGDRARRAGGPVTIQGRRGGSRTAHRRPRPDRRPRAAPAGGRAALADPPQAAAVRGPDRRDPAVLDRHQGDRPPRAARPRRKGGDVRRRRRRQDGAGDGAHPRHGRDLSGDHRVRRRRRALARRPRDAARHDRIRRARAHRAGLRADERAAGRALARADDGDDDRRIFPRRASIAMCCC